MAIQYSVDNLINSPLTETDISELLYRKRRFDVFIKVSKVVAFIVTMAIMTVIMSVYKNDTVYVYPVAGLIGVMAYFYQLHVYYLWCCSWYPIEISVDDVVYAPSELENMLSISANPVIEQPMSPKAKLLIKKISKLKRGMLNLEIDLINNINQKEYEVQDEVKDGASV